MADSVSPSSGGPYRVLARKYRPSDFSALIGQDAMVRTLTNAFARGRLAHAYMLTGVRGVGKTTTARIIARALNCIGPDGAGGPTIQPCGVCEHCRAIAEDHHVDVMEMDAASHTGVGDIREIIEGVRYQPATARYKIYIIDEVHMLSSNAFNALLKTLEEPPAHVVFIFATTEIRKVPITVLSRCQRFDLRRVDADVLARHFSGIAEREGIAAEPDAIQLIARAADGSVRDGLSLLDQAIAHAGGGAIQAEPVRAMLGLADREGTLDIFEAVIAGDAATALAKLDDQYAVGADPQMTIQDLLELVHWLTRVKVVPAAALSPEATEAERVRGRTLAERLSMPVLTRAWQMLFKGLSEVQAAEAPLGAAEMVLVRLAYAADLPTPVDALRALADAQGSATGRDGPDGPNRGGGPGGGLSAGEGPRGSAASPDAPRAGPGVAPAGGVRATRAERAAPMPSPPAVAEAPAAPAKADPASFADVVALASALKEGKLYALLVNNVHLVRFERGRIEFRPTAQAPGDLANRLSRFLNDATARRWVVTVANAEGEPTMAQVREGARDARRREAAAHPLVRAVLAAFPGAEIEDVRDRRPPDQTASPALAADSPPASFADDESGESGDG